MSGQPKLMSRAECEAAKARCAAATNGPWGPALGDLRSYSIRTGDLRTIDERGNGEIARFDPRCEAHANASGGDGPPRAVFLKIDRIALDALEAR